jgi:prepilin-type N-terminal cleavage/methylation domain-containing protein
MTNDRIPAFTLIELLVVTAILAVVVGVIGACLAGGIRVWETAREFATLEKEALVGLSLMEKDLMNRLPIHAIGFEGKETSLSLPAMLTAGGAPQIGAVEYTLNPGNGVLMRRERDYRGAYVREEPWVVNVAAMKLAYFNLVKGEGSASVWKELAAPVTNFPDRVDITLSLEKGDKSFDLSRSVLFPVVVR